MKKALVVLFVLGFAASALASVEIFLTTAKTTDARYIGGLTAPALNFDPTGDLYKDLGPRTAPLYMLDRNVAIQNTHPALAINPAVDGNVLYMWFQFKADAPGQKVQGIDINWTPAALISELAYYVVDNLNGSSVTGNADKFKRWDGAYTATVDPEFKLNPQVLVAVQTEGLQNKNAPMRWWGPTTYWGPGGTGPGENLQGQYFYDDMGTEDEGDDVASTIFLLGAIKVLPGTYDLLPHIGDLGIGKFPGGVLYPQNQINLVGAHIFPEPTSMLLLGLAGLLLRRR